MHEPMRLPCKHAFCKRCIDNLERVKGEKCLNPQCNVPIPKGYVFEPIPKLQKYVKQHNEYREKCNAFFMDVVSQLCFAGHTPPDVGVVKMLMELVLSASETGGKTGDICVYDDYIDKTPVVRTFLLQLLLRSE